jgi:hypothetical protein
VSGRVGIARAPGILVGEPAEPLGAIGRLRSLGHALTWGWRHALTVGRHARIPRHTRILRHGLAWGQRLA